MTPVVPCSTSSILLFPGTALAVGKASCLKRCHSSRKSSKHTLSFERFALTPPASVSLFSRYRRNAFHHKLSATGTDVAVDESESPVENQNSDAASEIPANSETSEKPSSTSARRFRNARKSDLPPIKNEDLIPGATFTGKVRSIQPFGAFVDIGAFADGLVHVSRLSDGFVKDVGSIVSVGQEVKVTLIEVNFETKRIGLSMREGDDGSKSKQQKDGSSSSGDPRPARKGPPRSSQKKTSKFRQGENLVGTVKNLTRSGAFISLPGEEEGFLPKAEENREGFDSIMGGTSLVVGEEVKVRVLRTNRGQVTLTMKEEVTGQDSGTTSKNLWQGEVHIATNPFMLAFRKNNDIAVFLDERERQEKEAKIAEEPNISQEMEKVDQHVTGSDITEVQDPIASTDVGIVSAPVSAAEDETAEDERASSNEADVDTAVLTTEKEEEASSEILAPEGNVSTTDQLTTEADVDIVKNDDVPESVASSKSPTLDGAELIIEKEEEVSSETLAQEGDVSTTNQLTTEADVDTVKNDDALESIASSPSSTVDDAEPTIEKDEEVSSEILAPEDSISVTDQIVEEAPPKDEGESDTKAESSEEITPSESAVAQVEENQTDSAESKDEVQQAPTTENEVPAVPPVEETKASISPSLVKQLREETGAGMMDCKNALLETEGDIAKAQEFLRKKGLASADKKASRATAEGRIGSYIHDGRIGVLVEVNCETDFVSRGDIFKELVDDLAMQVAACPQVQYLNTEDVPEEIVNKEKDLEMQKEDLLSKPEQMRSRIVEGRIRKRLEELALLEQPYIKSDKVVVKDWVKQTIATVGENMKVKRFVRFNLGEGLEKKSQDFAAEVAAQTAAKPVPAPEKEEPTPVEAKESDETRPPAVAISAALVKQLRDETGAGMMDCKKALSETGGDLERAQEYLRKKGLLSADKKSSRLAAEGRIGSYIHDSRIGVLIEVNCETDFVGRSEKFKELVDDLAMQVVASPLVQFVSIEDIPESVAQKEKELEMQRDDLQNKPENIREKIVEGRVLKRLGALALLEQPFIKDDSILVKDLVKQSVAAIGENIKVRRFVRFTLGETN